MNAPANPQAKRHLGQILIDQGILTEDQLRIALLEQTKSHVPVGRLLVQLGFVSEATLRDALSEKLGLQAVDLGHIIVDPKTKRFDTYERQSKRTGWGTITRESGEVQVYDNNGNRVGSGTLPAPPPKR